MKKVLVLLMFISLSFFVFSQEVENIIDAVESQKENIDSIDEVSDEVSDENDVVIEEDTDINEILPAEESEESEVLLSESEESDEKELQLEALQNTFDESKDLILENLNIVNLSEDRIVELEELKANLNDLRVETKNLINEFNLNQNIQTQLKITEVNEEPWLTVDLKDEKPTREALKRRENTIAALKASGEVIKTNFATEQNAKLAAEEKILLPQINSAYKKLEKDTYIMNSLQDAFFIDVESFNGEDSTWKLHMTANFLGHENVFEENVSLGYADVTGKKIKPLTQLTDAELEEYNRDVELYDTLFHYKVPVFYAKLYYKIMRWSGASEYHIIPTKCEIIRLGEKPKVIKTIAKKDLRASEIIQEPALEIRSEQEIKDDLARTNKTIIQERKEQGLYAVTKKGSYNTSTTKTKLPVYKKRNSFYISGDYFNTNIFEDNLKSPTALDVQANLTLSALNYTYLGISGGVQKWNYNEDDSKVSSPIFFAKIHPGFTFPLGSYFRIYGEGGFEILASPYNFNDYNVKYNTNTAELKPGNDFCMGIYAGAGLDIIFARPFMFTLGVDYNWMHYAKTFAVVQANNEGVMTVFANPDFHYLEYSLGVGITW